MRDHETIAIRRRILGHKSLSLAPAYWTVMLCVLAAGLALSTAPALAATPEQPETGKASAVTTTTATLEAGVLNPKAKGEAGEYEYRFRVSETECEGESSTPPEAAAGNEKEVIPPVNLTNLQPNAHYTFCLIEHNLAGEYSLASTPEHFTTKAAPPAVESEASFPRTQAEAFVEAQVNPNNQATSCAFEYGTSMALGTSVPCEPATLEGFGGRYVFATLAGLSPNTVYYDRVAAENGAGKAEGVPIQQFTSPPLLPTVTTGFPSSITQTAATVAGAVNGQGADTTYYFRYVEAAKYEPSESNPYHGGGQLPSPPADGGVISSDTPESTQLTGLRPNTTYHYQLVADNQFCSGPCATGSDATFSTLALAPLASADSPANLSPNSATLTGSVDPHGVAGSYHFEYGTTTTYGTSLPEAAVAASESGLGVSAGIAGLAPDTTYHFRVVASNNGGTTDSTDETFTTYASEAQNSGLLPPGFSLTGTAPGGPTAVSFPNLAGFTPMPPFGAGTKGFNSSSLTRAQKLSKALKACKKDTGKAKRTKCERDARRKYGPKAKKKK
jgi:hypothetical protein